MSAERLPNSVWQHTYTRSFRRWSPFLRSNGSLRTCLFIGAIVLTTLVIYTTFSSQHESLWHRLSDWGLPQREFLASIPKHEFPLMLPHAPDIPTEPPHLWGSSSSDVLTLKQIRDIMAPTRGFFTRDYSLGLGWNNVRVYAVPYLS